MIEKKYKCQECLKEYHVFTPKCTVCGGTMIEAIIKSPRAAEPPPFFVSPASSSIEDFGPVYPDDD